MFSVYGKAGRIFRGTMEGLRHIGAVTAAAKSRASAPIGRDPEDQTPAQIVDAEPPANTDFMHRGPVTAYEQTRTVEHVRQPLTRADAVMSPVVVTLKDTLTVEEAWQLLVKHRVGQAPVVSAEGTLVGLLSRADLMRPERLPGPESHALVWRTLLMQSVVDLMWTPVPSVAPETDIRRIARVLLDTGLPGLPVVNEQGGVVGFVSRSDILRAVVADPPLDLWT
jgi:CBS-domain-containing membrane protein